MPTLRWNALRTVASRHHLAAVAAAFVALALVFTSVAVSGSSSTASANHGATSVAIGQLVGPATTIVADGFGVIEATTSEMIVAVTPPPPPPTYCPAPGAEFIDSWGFARSGGRRHKGVDMMAPHGTPVIAPVSGWVRPSNSRLGGIGFYLDDADGNTYFGAHLASLDVTGWVEAGTQIGTVGSSGNASASGPHLHFEVMLAGRGSVNPYPFAAAWCGILDIDPFAA